MDGTQHMGSIVEVPLEGTFLRHGTTIPSQPRCRGLDNSIIANIITPICTYRYTMRLCAFCLRSFVVEGGRVTPSQRLRRRTPDSMHAEP